MLRYGLRLGARRSLGAYQGAMLRCMSSAAATSSQADALPIQTVVEHSDTLQGPRRPGAFAIVKLPGTQHKVTVGDVIVAEKMKVELGQLIVLDQVLLLGTVHETVVGHPFVEDAKVVVHVDEITKDKKVIIFKKRKRKNSRRKRGYRRDVTLLRVVDIVSESLKLDHLPPPMPPRYYMPQAEMRSGDDGEDEEGVDEQDIEALGDDDDDDTGVKRRH